MSNLLENAPSLSLATACSARIQKTWLEVMATNESLSAWRSRHQTDDEDDLETSDLNVGLELAARMQRLTGQLQTLSRLGMRLCDKSLRVIGTVVESLTDSPTEAGQLASLSSTVEAHRAIFDRQLERANKLAELAKETAQGVWLHVAGGMPATVRPN